MMAEVACMSLPEHHASLRAPVGHPCQDRELPGPCFCLSVPLWAAQVAGKGWVSWSACSVYRVPAFSPQLTHIS